MNFHASPKAVVAVMLTLLLLGDLKADAQDVVAAPPPVTAMAPWEQVEEVIAEDPASIEARAVTTEPEIVTTAFGDGVSTWTENAENGLVNVIDGTDASYPLIVPGIGVDGSKAFHLAHPTSNSQSFELDVDIDVQANTKLFFMSKLQWATSGQIAQVRISTNGGSSWMGSPVYSQSGTGTAGEASYSLRTVDLGAAHANQQLRIRFEYNRAGGYFAGADNDDGWLIDNIQIGPEFQKIEWKIGNPTPTEVLYLEYINRARADAFDEANRLASLTNPDVTSAYGYFGITGTNIVNQFNYYLSGTCMALNAQPLAFQKQLMEMAQKHTLDMYTNKFQGHVSSLNPPAPFQPGDTISQRRVRVGYGGSVGENVYAYSKSVEYGHAAFDVDWGNLNGSGSCYNQQFDLQGMQNPAGHRKSIHNASYREIGVGVINGTNGSVGPQIVTQDFGISPTKYITGVVYEDSDDSGMYSAASDSSHEGVGGVRIDVAGVGYYAMSTPSGAYAVPVTGDGTYQVTFSGDGIDTFTTEVVVSGGLNVKLDRVLPDTAVSSRFYSWAATHGLEGGPEDDDDNDGVSNVIESLVAGMNPTVSDANLLPRFVKQPNGDWQLTLIKQPDADDVAVTVWISSDLSNWQEASTMGSSVSVIDSPEELTIVTSSSHSMLYARYDVTLVP